MKVIVLDGHPRSEELADYVGDLLEDADCERIEAHVSSCPPCAARLEEAAGFQMMLHDVAASMPVPATAPIIIAPAPSVLGRVRRHVTAVSGLWAAAAAFTLMLWTSGEVEPHEHVATRVAAPTAPNQVVAAPRRAGCDDPSCPGLLASVDPLESIDPLSSWPDDPLVRAGFDESPGEPCGSGEDGGPLVCPTSRDPFSG